MRDEWPGALRTEQDYVDCAKGASPAVRRVRVRGCGNTPGMTPGVVEVRPRRSFGRKLRPFDFVTVHEALVARKPTFVALKMVK